MTRTADNGVALCYAETAGTHWAAYCLSFDLAVEGASLAEVRGKLAEQISLYLETVRACLADQARLIRRRAPLHAFVTLFYRMLRSIVTTGGSMRSDYTEPFQA